MTPHHSTLPVPDTAERDHSARVITRIQDEMAGESIDFSQYMDIALHAPGLGYYPAGSWKLGAGGDFITAPELGNLFGRCIARQCREVLQQTDGGRILEFGAGSGALCCQILEYLDKQDALPTEYLILETSPDLKMRQMERIARLADDCAGRVKWLDDLPKEPLSGVVIANEILDVFPVQCFRVADGGHYLAQVVSKGNKLEWDELFVDEPVDPINKLIRQYALPADYRSEYCPNVSGFVHSLRDVLHAGAVLLVDYGYSGAEYYHHQRTQGTLRCHFRHHAHNDPLILAGIQDITAHVDFSRTAKAASDAGFQLMGFCTQANFLMNCGLVELLTSLPDPAAQMEQANEVKRLTLPSEMGEVFKVLGLGVDLEQPMTGFAQGDRLHTLLEMPHD